MKYSRSKAKQWVRDTLRGYVVTTATPFQTDRPEGLLHA